MSRILINVWARANYVRQRLVPDHNKPLKLVRSRRVLQLDFYGGCCQDQKPLGFPPCGEYDRVGLDRDLNGKAHE